MQTDTNTTAPVDTSSGIGDFIVGIISFFTDISMGIAHFVHESLGFGAFGTAALTIFVVIYVLVYVLGKIFSEMDIYSPAKIAGFSILFVWILNGVSFRKSYGFLCDSKRFSVYGHRLWSIPYCSVFYFRSILHKYLR